MEYGRAGIPRKLLPSLGLNFAVVHYLANVVQTRPTLIIFSLLKRKKTLPKARTEHERIYVIDMLDLGLGHHFFTLFFPAKFI